MLNISEFLSLVSWEAAGIAGAVLVIVELLKRTNLVKGGDWSRYATMVLSALFTEADANDPETVAFTAVVMVIASGAHELIELLKKKYDEYKKGKEEAVV